MNSELISKINKLFNVSQQNLLLQQQEAMNYIHIKHPERTICPNSFDSSILFQGTYFNTFDVNQSCVNIVQDILNKIIQRYEISHNINDLSYSISIKDFISNIDYSSLSNFKNFHLFLDLLKQNSNGYLFIQVKQAQNFYLPPIKYKSDIKGNLMTDSYQRYITNLTKNCKNWNECNQKIMNDLFKTKNLGTINISPKCLKRNNEYLKIVIEHQVTHFLKFLIRINSLNYKYGLYFSHKDFKQQNYFDKPDQWKQLATTYIEELMVIFKQMNVDLTADQYLDIVLKGCDLKPLGSNISPNQYKFMQIFQNHFHKQFIVLFFQNTFKNKANSIRNNWKVLLKWFKGQFKKRFS